MCKSETDKEKSHIQEKKKKNNNTSKKEGYRPPPQYQIYVKSREMLGRVNYCRCKDDYMLCDIIPPK